MIETVAKYYGIDVSSLKESKKGKSNKPRLVAMYLTNEICQQTLLNVAKEFGNISYGGVSNNCRKISRDLNNENMLRDEVAALMSLLHYET